MPGVQRRCQSREGDNEVNKRMEIAAIIGALVQTIDEHADLDDICALLCAVGAACGDEDLAAKLLVAINPVMVAAFIDLTARNN